MDEVNCPAFSVHLQNVSLGSRLQERSSQRGLQETSTLHEQERCWFLPSSPRYEGVLKVALFFLRNSCQVDIVNGNIMLLGNC